jgi:putative phosphoribosyl transferase
MESILIKEVVKIPLNEAAPQIFVEGNLVIPDNPIGFVIFAHGSGSSRKSTRNELVSQKLNENSIGTLLFDLLTKEEQESDIKLENIISEIPGGRFNKFNIALLTQRLVMATEWVVDFLTNRSLSVSYFASSTGAAAALTCATIFHISTIVIRSGRSDLINYDNLLKIVSSCLFVVGGKERTLIKINKKTIKELKNAVEKKLIIVPNASHQFEEEGSMEIVASLSAEWLKKHFYPLANTSDNT